MGSPVWCLGVLFFVLTASAFIKGMPQEKLDYMAQYMHVAYRVLDNLQDSRHSYTSQISLTNTGQRDIPGEGWTIFFSQLTMVEPVYYPHPRAGRLLKKYNVRFKHVQGGFFSLEPDEGFQDIAVGDTRHIRFTSHTFSVARTDSFPNWYLAAPGLEPRTLVNTANEALDWVEAFDTENAWKRYDFLLPDNTEVRDRYEPYSTEARYEVNAVEDLGGAPKQVLPTPFSIRVVDNSHVQLNTKDWVVYPLNKFPREEKMLAERLGIRVVSAVRPGSHVIFFKSHDPWWSVGEKTIGGPEAYTLIVDPSLQVIEIKAHSSPGAFYGAMTLLNLMDEHFRVPEVKVIDAPRFKYRGLMLDVARNFRPVDDVLKLLELMALYKLNKLHLHLTDDQGWRLQIPGLEELTGVGGQRCHDLEETSCLLPFLGSGPLPGTPGSGFYTAEDYRKILSFAADRHIQVIPEVEMPGHAHAAMKAMEARRQRYQAAGNDTEAQRHVLADDDDVSWYHSSQLFTDNAINPCLDSTYRFVTRVVRSLVEMHHDVMPLQLLHVGGMGVAQGAWSNSSSCQTLLAAHFRGFKDLKEYFLRKVSAILVEEGLNMAAWEGALTDSQGGAPYTRARLSNDQVYAYAWNNVWEDGGAAQGAYKLANAGYKVVMSQATHLSFDHPYEPDPEERGLYWATRLTPTKKMFSFMPSDLYANADVTGSGDPVDPATLCGEGKACVDLKEPDNIVGIQGQLWTEVIRTKEQADYMLFPRFFALAERAWHKPSWEGHVVGNMTRLEQLEADWSAFANTLGYRELARLDRLGVEYRVPPPGGVVSGGKLQTNVAFPGLQVEHSADEGATWCHVNDVIPVRADSSILLRTRSAGGGRYSRTVRVERGDNSAATRAYAVASLCMFLAASVSLAVCGGAALV